MKMDRFRVENFSPLEKAAGKEKPLEMAEEKKAPDETGQTPARGTLKFCSLFCFAGLSLGTGV
jgi:hypothetical protein